MSVDRAVGHTWTLPQALLGGEKRRLLQGEWPLVFSSSELHASMEGEGLGAVWGFSNQEAFY